MSTVQSPSRPALSDVVVMMEEEEEDEEEEKEEEEEEEEEAEGRNKGRAVRLRY